MMEEEINELTGIHLQNITGGTAYNENFPIINEDEEIKKEDDIDSFINKRFVNHTVFWSNTLYAIFAATIVDTAAFIYYWKKVKKEHKIAPKLKNRTQILEELEAIERKFKNPHMENIIKYLYKDSKDSFSLRKIQADPSLLDPLKKQEIAKAYGSKLSFYKTQALVNIALGMVMFGVMKVAVPLAFPGYLKNKDKPENEHIAAYAQMGVFAAIMGFTAWGYFSEKSSVWNKEVIQGRKNFIKNIKEEVDFASAKLINSREKYAEYNAGEKIKRYSKNVRDALIQTRAIPSNNSALKNFNLNKNRIYRTLNDNWGEIANSLSETRKLKIDTEQLRVVIMDLNTEVELQSFNIEQNVAIGQYEEIFTRNITSSLKTNNYGVINYQNAMISIRNFTSLTVLNMFVSFGLLAGFKELEEGKSKTEMEKLDNTSSILSFVLPCVTNLIGYNLFLGIPYLLKRNAKISGEAIEESKKSLFDTIFGNVGFYPARRSIEKDFYVQRNKLTQDVEYRTAINQINFLTKKEELERINIPGAKKKSIWKMLEKRDELLSEIGSTLMINVLGTPVLLLGDYILEKLTSGHLKKEEN